MFRRTCTNVSLLAPCNSQSKNLRLPSWTERNPPIKVSKVVFPEPDGPDKITISPDFITKLMSNKIWLRNDF